MFLYSVISNRMNINYSFIIKKLSSKKNLNSYKPPFEKILIANRGEIAIRIIKTCEKMGIKTVAIFSEADKDALFTQRATENFYIGQSESVYSYLNVNKIIEACKITKSEAVHPGYGFLSEKHWFASKLEENGIVFIGPSVEALRLMGDKLESKKIAKSAGVSIVPGFDDLIQSDDHAVKIAHEIGYPVMVKAAGGGGGKGMRIAFNDQQLKEGYFLSKQEAKSSFNDDRIIIEKFIEDPHHIEFQILGDKHGNIIHLNERECSIQRRNQKLLEEAPSPSLDEKTRTIMGEQAKSLAKMVGYSSAGTVEFLLDKYGRFYFLEMNTRLQVEHPVTESITGIDIVEQMIKGASGQKLLISQNDVKINGWALECRVNAENPFKNFGSPSIGRLTEYKEPLVDKYLRIDSGIVEGSEISVYYDSMISKLITTGQTRQQSIDRMKSALDTYFIRGVTTNICLLRDIISDPKFVNGNFTTGFLLQTYGNSFKPKLPDEKQIELLLFTAVKSYILDNFKSISETDSIISELRLIISIEDNTFFYTIDSIVINKTTKLLKMSINNVFVEKYWSFINNYWRSINWEDKILFHKKIDSNTQKSSNCSTVHIFDRKFELYYLKIHGLLYKLRVFTETQFELNKFMKLKEKNDKQNGLYAPMSGIVISINCKVGNKMESGQDVMVVEAMKMQNNLTLGHDATIKRILVKKGDKVTEGDLLIDFESH